MQSPERLKLLLLLTVADIRAVGPKVWNGWKAALLRELYYSALELMTGGAQRAARRADRGSADRRGAGGGARPGARVGDRGLTLGPPRYPFYWLSLQMPRRMPGTPG